MNFTKKQIYKLISAIIFTMLVVMLFFNRDKIIANYKYYSAIKSLKKIELTFDKKNKASLYGQLEELNRIKWNDLPYEGKKHYVYGQIKENEVKIRAKIVGIYNDHWKIDKPSLKINSIKNEILINDISGFGLLNPKTRDFLGDWIASEFEKRLGLLSLKRDYALVSINENGEKVYILEESFKSFSKRHSNGLTFSYSILEGTVSIKVYNDVYDESVKKQIQNMLTNFINSPEENISIFNLDKMALFYSVNDLVQGFHQLIEPNTHLFYDLKTKKIEAIGREWNSSHQKNNEKLLTIDYVQLNDLHDFLLHSKIFSSQKFKNKYKRVLNRLSKHDLNNFFEERDEKVTLYTECLWKDRGSLDYSFEYIFNNMKFIRNSLKIELESNK